MGGRSSRSEREAPPEGSRSLFKRYFLALFLVMLVPLVSKGASDVWFGYRDQRALIEALLQRESLAAAQRIDAFLGELAGQLGWMTQLADASGTIERRRVDALRLLRQAPAVTTVSHLDPNGIETLRVSRLDLDIIDAKVSRAEEPAFLGAVGGKTYFGPVYFNRGSEPYLTMAVSGRRRDAGVAIAEVNLKFIWDVIAAIRVGNAGLAYVLDADGRLIAHPDLNLVLRGTDQAVGRNVDLIDLAALRGSTALIGREADRRLVSLSSIPGPRWIVAAEQPLSEAFAPIYAAAGRTLLMLMAGAALAAALAFLMAHRMSVPIKLLERGADEIGAGNFTHRIRIATGDELQRLADRFNKMAGDLAESKERSERISRLKRFLSPQVAELVERSGTGRTLESRQIDVVVIFCDLRRFTTFAAQAEPKEVMRVLEEYYARLGPIIIRYEATQTCFSGDGLMMLLNAPFPCHEPARHAARMATEMQAAVQDQAMQWRARGYGIGFGIGMAEGPATVGQIGYESRTDYTAIGSVVNLASRLCSTARDGEILIDAQAASSIGDALPLQLLPPQRIKGFEGEIDVYTLSNATCQLSRNEIPATPP